MKNHRGQKRGEELSSITPHRQTIGYIRSKRQTRKNTIITKQKQVIRTRFSKQRNAVSESDTNTLQELQEKKDSLNKNNPIDDQMFFSDSEAITTSSKKGKRKIKNSLILLKFYLYWRDKDSLSHYIFSSFVSLHSRSSSAKRNQASFHAGMKPWCPVWCPWCPDLSNL